MNSIIERLQYVEETFKLLALAAPGPSPRPGLEGKEETRFGLTKAPPGPKPAHFGDDIIWDDSRSHWVKPTEQGPARAGYSSTFTPGHPQERVLPMVHNKRDLPAAQAYALGAYTSIVSEVINKHLREGSELDDTTRMVVDPLLEMAQPLGDRVHTVYRGVGLGIDRDNLSVGQELPVDSFMSTSRDPAAALKFGGSKVGVLMEIHPDADTRAIILADNFDNRGEAETIFTPDHSLVIREIHRDVRAPNYSYETVPYYIVASLHDRRRQGEVLRKAPPGPPPRPGLEWKEETHRWIRPENWLGGERHAVFDVGDEVHYRPNKSKKSSVGTVVGFWGDGSVVVQPEDSRVHMSVKPERIDGRVGEVEVPVPVVKPSKKRPKEQISRTPDAPPIVSGISSILPEDGRISGGDIVEFSTSVDKLFNASEAPTYVNPHTNDALAQYVGSVGEEEDEEEIKPDSRSMQQLFGPLHQSQQVYRGIKLSPEELGLVVGQAVKLEKFTSTSRRPDVALGFTSDMGVLLEIRAGRDALGITLDDEDTGYDESETILGLGQDFQVDSIHPLQVSHNDGTSKVLHLVRGRVNYQEASIQKALVKAAPGPKPDRFGDDIVWDDNRSHWVKPVTDSEGEVEDPSSSPLKSGAKVSWVNAKGVVGEGKIIGNPNSEGTVAVKDDKTGNYHTLPVDMVEVIVPRRP